MISPVYEVLVTYRGTRYYAPVKAIQLLGDNWAIGYITPTGSRRKLTVKGNEHTLDNEAACIDRLNQIAAHRGWRKWKNDDERLYAAM